jgi:hypothetical protein
MVHLAPRSLSELPEIVFEPDRFELADGRLELSGRWYGVQGRRFMRPSLTVRHGEGETRLLADLEHKPWAAENGERWHAAFPCDRELDGGVDAELTVAPDLTVEVVVPGGSRSRADADGGRDTEARQDAEPREDAERGEAVRPAQDPAASDDRDQLEQSEALSAARAEIETLNRRVTQMTRKLEQERTRFARELDEAQGAIAETVRECEDAIAARHKAIDERQIAEKRTEEALAARGKATKVGRRALAHREDALARLDDAVAQRDRAVAQLEQALTQRDRAGAQLEQALTQRDQALTERDQALAQRVEALTQRDQAVLGLDQAGAERDELATAHDQRRANSENTLTTRAALSVMRNAAIESGPRRQAQWTTVAVAVAALLVVTFAVALILGLN